MARGVRTAGNDTDTGRESGPETGKDIARMSFEDALGELEEIVKELEEGRVRLDEAIAAYERGAKLKAHCEKKLAEAKAKVEKITLGPGGAEGTEPADIG